MNITRALTIDGWMGQEELEYLAKTASKSRRILELGSWMGRSTCALAENTGGIVFAVDTWRGSPEHQDELRQHPDGWLFSEFQRNIQGLNNIWPIPLDSRSAFKLLREAGIIFDMIFIDASHDYEDVKHDIKTWRTSLTCYGILCGHDLVGDYPGVAKAVKEMVPKYRQVGTTSIWTTEAI